MPSWQPEPQDFAKLLDEQNPWLSSGHVPDVLAPPVERALARQLFRPVSAPGHPRFQVVLGPRRVGKTTVMYQTIRHLLESGLSPRRCLWLRLDHPLLLQIPLNVLVSPVVGALPPGVEAFLFLDELVYARDWDLWLKTFFDERWPVRIVATSSATAALRGRRLESGVGRWDEQYLAPYLFSEFLDLVGSGLDVPTGAHLGETLESLGRVEVDLDALAAHRRRLMLVGGFPELIVDAGAYGPEEEEDLLLRSQQVLRSDAVERAIYKDIPQSFNIDRPMMLERLCYVLAGQVASLLSPRNVCQLLEGLTLPTFERYLSYLEHAFIVFTLPNFSGNEAGVQRRGRKCYFVDPAVRNAALQRGLLPLRNPAELGLLSENLVATNLHALAIQTGVRLYHWRDGKHEVDLVYDHPDRPLAIEIGLSSDHSRTGLEALVTRHPRFQGGCWLAAPGLPHVRPEEATSGIGLVPLDLLLGAVGRQAERAMANRLVVPRPAS
jgi:predicted AAA+ superfamily ATPase